LSVDEGRQVDEHGDILTRAQRAYAAQDWRSAAARFDAVPPERLTADDLAAYADAVWWLGGEQEARLVALTCSAPPQGHKRWTLRLLADRLVELQVVESVSYETVRQVLQQTSSSRG
jgi:hypothetical protein